MTQSQNNPIEYCAIVRYRRTTTENHTMHGHMRHTRNYENQEQTQCCYVICAWKFV